MGVVECSELCEDHGVPLSEEEQRQLEEIERQFYETDPQLAHAVRSTTVVPGTGRALGFGVAGLVVSFVVLLLGFTHNVLLGVVGFVGMILCALVVERHARGLGRASVWAIKARVAERAGQSGQSGIRQRLRRKDDE